MPKANGTVMVKYIKIKSGGKGVKACADYINNPEKTIERISEPPDTGFVANIKRLLNYAEEDKKTFDPAGRQYVSGLNCNPDTAVKEFSNAERAYHLHHQERLNEGHKANQAYHIILSYKGTDMTPEIVHNLGKEFAQRICRNNYQAVVATHLNTDNYHNHILINAYARDGSHKLQDQKNFYKNLRYIADSISRGHNLPVNGNGMKYHPKPYKSWAAEQKRKKEMYMRLRTGAFGEQYLHNGEQKSFRAYKNRYKDNYRGQNFYSIDEYGLIKANDYDIYGRRRLELEKLFLCVIAGIREGYYHALLEHQEEIKIYEQVQQAIEVVKKYKIAEPEQIDSRLRYYHGMKNAGQKEIRAANSDDAYMTAAKRLRKRQKQYVQYTSLKWIWKDQRKSLVELSHLYRIMTIEKRVRIEKSGKKRIHKKKGESTVDDEKLLDFSKELSMLKTLYDGKHLTDSEYEQILKSIKAEYGCSIPVSFQKNFQLKNMEDKNPQKRPYSGGKRLPGYGLYGTMYLVIILTIKR